MRSSRLKVIVALVVALVAVIVTLLALYFFLGGSAARASGRIRRPVQTTPDISMDDDWDRRWKQLEDESAERTRRAEEELAKIPAPTKHRRVKMFQWESPAETRAKLWNVPEEEDNEATATAFFRICISESDGYEPDCLGIWQVLKTIRSRSCDRARVTRITECDDNGETMLSAMRRASKSVVGVVAPRTRRQQWVSKMELSCDEPENWPGTSKEWERQYATVRCPRVAKLARDLVAGVTDFDWPYSGVHAIAWGGRCESGRGACDDDHACSRGLARLFTDTQNAFWCIPGSEGCSDDIDPVCIKRGWPSRLKVVDTPLPVKEAAAKILPIPEV